MQIQNTIWGPKISQEVHTQANNKIEGSYSLETPQTSAILLQTCSHAVPVS